MDIEKVARKLKDDESPLKLSLEKAELYWIDRGHTLTAVTGLDHLELMQAVQVQPLEIQWAPNVVPVTVKWRKESLIKDFLLGLDIKTQDSRTVLKIPSLKVHAEGRRTEGPNRQSGYSLQFIFSQPMVPWEKTASWFKIEEAPLKLDPPRAGRAYFMSPQILLLELASLPEEEYARQIMDQPFALSFSPEAENLFGQKAASLGAQFFSQLGTSESLAGFSSDNKITRFNARNFFLDRFKVLSFQQAGFTPDGRVIMDLAFNKAVKKEDLLRSLTLRKGNKQSGPLPAAYEILEMASGNLLARIALSAKNGQIVTADLASLASADGRGLIKKDWLLQNIASNFTLRGTSLERDSFYPWAPYFRVNIAEDFPETDLAPFIVLDPPLPFKVETESWRRSSLFIRAPFTRNQEVKVTLKAGLPSAEGVLEEDTVFTAKLPDVRDSRLIFTGRGRYLTPSKPLQVQIAGRDADFIRVQGWKIFENNLPPLINISPILNLDQKPQAGIQMAENVLDFEVPLGGEGLDSFERLLDLGELLDRKTGPYLLKVTPVVLQKDGRKAAFLAHGGWRGADSDYRGNSYLDYHEYRSNPERYLTVMVTDLALSARVFPGAVHVWAASISKGQPEDQAVIRVYDRAGQAAAEGVTGPDGLFAAEIPRGTENISFISVRKGGDLSYILINTQEEREAGALYAPEENEYCRTCRSDSSRAVWFDEGGGYLADSGRTYDGDYLTKGYEGFLFLPRDIWKPGETLAVKGLIRNSRQEPPAVGLPLIWQVADPNRRVIEEGRAEVSAAGSLDFTSQIPFSGLSGPYEVRLVVPGEETPLARAWLKVEDFQPPRLQLELKADKEEYVGPEPAVIFQGQARYLFGAPGDGLSWEMSASLRSGWLTAEKFPNFDFSGPEQTSLGEPVLKEEGTLDENGRMILEWSPSLEIGRLPNLVNLRVSFAAAASSGRFEGKTETFRWFTRPVLVGFQMPESVRIGTPAEFRLAAVTPQGQPAAAKNFKVTVSQILTRYYNEVRSGRVYRRPAEELVLVREETVPLTEGLGKFAAEFKNAGTFQLAAGLEGENEILTRRFEVTGLAEPVPGETPPPDRLVLTLDQASYRPGQEARLQIEAPFAGWLWLSLETDHILWSKVIEAGEKTLSTSFPVPEEILANAHLTGVLVRPLEPGVQTFLVQSRISLETDRSRNTIRIETSLPEKIRPSSEVPVEIRLTGPDGQPLAGEVTLALVDEGILSLTNYQIPDPAGFFGRSRNLLSRFLDMHDQILPPAETVRPFLAPGGGDGDELAGLFSPFQRKQELLSIFETSVPVGPDGRGQVTLKLPEYSGQGRLTAVAASGGKFGLKRQTLPINRDFTAEPSLPLALAPGDTLESTIRVFADPKAAGGQAELEIGFQGALSLLEAEGFSGRKISFELQPGESRLFKLTLKAVPENGGDLVGPAEMTVKGRLGGETLEVSATTVVRPPFPRAVRKVSGLVKEDQQKVELFSGGFLPGTVEAGLSLAGGPWVSAGSARAYLENYPYGCLEQTVSQAWAFLTVSDLGKASQTEIDSARAGLMAAVKRLATMQNYQGALSYWPGRGETYEWGSVYAAHFLTAAAGQISLPSGLLTDLLSYLRQNLSSGYNRTDDLQYTLAVKAYTLYVLALNGEFLPGWLNSVSERQLALTPSAAIFLAGARAIQEGNSAALKELDRQKLTLDLNTLAVRRSSLESLVRNEALLLLVWAEVDPLADRTMNLALELGRKGESGRWTNTQENGLALWALANFVRKTRADAPYLAAVASAGGAEIGTATNEDLASWKSRDLVPHLAQPLTITVRGQGRPYYSGYVSGVPLEAPAPVSEGLSLKKSFVFPDGVSRIFSQTEYPGDLAVNKGQKIKVILDLETKTALQNAVLVDLMPGGLEAAAAEDENNNSSARMEFREDRLVVILPQLSPGRTQLVYELRAVTNGDYVLPPAAAEGMYQPEKRAILPAGRIKVTEKADETE
ncbi:MAG: hypothetical protein LBK52_02935 [Deltaproteobacteria bacterium]|nr:hypothetical protein [Deltaproteobacteria bacterium]